MNRREVLAGVVAGLVYPSGAYADYFAPTPPYLGLQLYTVRDLMAVDVEATLTLVAEVGYRCVEFAGYFAHKPKELRRILDDSGLTAPSAHVREKDLLGNIDAVVESVQILGHEYLVLRGLTQGDGKTLDDFRRAAEQFNRWGEVCWRVARHGGRLPSAEAQLHP